MAKKAKSRCPGLLRTLLAVLVVLALAAQVFAEAGDTQFEDSTRQSRVLVYHFTCTAGPDGRTVYRLESIAVQ